MSLKRNYQIESEHEQRLSNKQSDLILFTKLVDFFIRIFKDLIDDVVSCASHFRIHRSFQSFRDMFDYSAYL